MDQGKSVWSGPPKQESPPFGELGANGLDSSPSSTDGLGSSPSCGDGFGAVGVSDGGPPTRPGGGG